VCQIELLLYYIWFLCQEGCPKNSINPEMNQSEAGPEIADEAHLHGGDGKVQFI
jgi:hypothetical protein